MSTASDISAFEHSVEPQVGEVIFKDKKWTYIQDSTSNIGQYSGQIQFNLSTISSQAAFVNWEEAFIELPVKLQILKGGASSVTSTTACTIDQLVPKCGAWQFIGSVSVVIDGTTVQTNQMHENVNATFKALTETQYNDYIKSDRSLFTSLDQQSGKLAFDIMGGTANLQSISKPQVYVAPAGAVAGGSPFYVAHYLATIKLRDICDYFKKCPMQKNTRGFIYINYNSSSTTIVTDATGGTFAITADVNGTPTAGTGLTPPQSFSRLLVPAYTPNPSADNSLIQKKSFRYFERITNKFTVLQIQRN